MVLPRPIDLLLSIVETQLLTSRAVIGGIEKLSPGFIFSRHYCLKRVVQTKLSATHPLHWAKVLANGKKCELNELGEPAGVALFDFL